MINMPVHAPTVMPYSLAMMKAALESSLNENISVIDLNALYHYEMFKEFYEKKNKAINNEDYFDILDSFMKETRNSYPKISRTVRENKKPNGTDIILQAILAKKPDVVGISLTYNSQVFFAKVIIEELKERGIDVVIGGPADYSKILKGNTTFANAKLFVDYLVKNGAKEHAEYKHAIIDYTSFEKKYYFTRDIVYTLRTSVSCPYKRCTFCTHHGNMPYKMINLSVIKEAILHNKMKKVCIIDDDIPVTRLKELANILKPLNVKWWCQLRPIKSIIPLLSELKSSGLTGVAWGVESGCQRVLDQMEKGTIVEDVENVLSESKSIGIYNNTYILFGLPTESKEEALETVMFLEKNKENIDLVSPSVFGLQQGSRIYSSPDEFGVSDIKTQKRTYLGDRVFYTPKSGQSNEEAKKTKKSIMKRIIKVNSIPVVINMCKEQVLNF